MSPNQLLPRRVVHLELHTPDQVRASAFYTELLHWRPEVVRAAAGSYLALDTGPHLGGGVVECGTRRPLWLPYVEVDRIDASTERARELGAVVLLEPREGPSGWRSIVSSPEAGEVALWGRSDERGAPAARSRTGRRRGGVRRPRRPLSAPASRALLPDARLRGRRRGRAAGTLLPRLERTRPLRESEVRFAPGSIGSPPTRACA